MVVTDREWADMQQREHNLRSFRRDRSVQMREYRLRKRESVEAVVAAADAELVFEPWQLAVAERVFGAGEAS